MQKNCFLFFILLFVKQIAAQTVPVGQTGTEEMLRILQLTTNHRIAIAVGARSAAVIFLPITQAWR